MGDTGAFPVSPFFYRLWIILTFQSGPFFEELANVVVFAVLFSRLYKRRAAFTLCEKDDLLFAPISRFWL